MDGLRWPVASSRGDHTQSVRGQAVHFFCKLVATGEVWKLVGITEAHVRRTHARAGAVGGCKFHLSTHPCHLLSTLLHEGAHISRPLWLLDNTLPNARSLRNVTSLQVREWFPFLSAKL
jgi:hypothetical protein